LSPPLPVRGGVHDRGHPPPRRPPRPGAAPRPDLLAELLGSEDLRELLDPDAIAAVELELQGLLPERFPRDVDKAHDLLVRLGDLSDEEALARGVSAGWLHALEKERRAATIRIAGEARWIAAEDAG